MWLEGDNPFNSTDSRSYGPVPLALVKGLVSFKVSDPLSPPELRFPLCVQSADPRSTIAMIYMYSCTPSTSLGPCRARTGGLA